jgi:ankyrin repeat protein
MYDTAKVFLKYDANVTDLVTRNDYVQATLRVFAGHDAELREILISKGIDASLEDRDGQNAAFFIAQRPDSESVQALAFLIENGVDVCKKNKRNKNTISTAIFFERTVLLRALIEAGCSVSETIDTGYYPVHACLSHRYKSANPIPLSISSLETRLEALGILVQNGATLNVSYEQSPFSTFVFSEIDSLHLIHVYKILVEKYQLDLNARNVNGATVLHFIVSNKGQPDSVRELIYLGADPNVRDANGATPLMIATEMGQAELTQVLLDNGPYYHATETMSNE